MNPEKLKQLQAQVRIGGKVMFSLCSLIICVVHDCIHVWFCSLQGNLGNSIVSKKEKNLFQTPKMMDHITQRDLTVMFKSSSTDLIGSLTVIDFFAKITIAKYKKYTGSG